MTTDYPKHFKLQTWRENKYKKTTDEMGRWFSGGRNRPRGLSIIVYDDDIVHDKWDLALLSTTNPEGQVIFHWGMIPLAFDESTPSCSIFTPDRESVASLSSSNLLVLTRLGRPVHLLETIKTAQIKWFGHMKGLIDDRAPKKIYEWMPNGNGKKGKTKLTWTQWKYENGKEWLWQDRAGCRMISRTCKTW